MASDEDGAGLAPSREGKKTLTVWIDAAAIRQLKVLAAESGRTQEALVREGLNDVFRRYGKPPIA